MSARTDGTVAVAVVKGRKELERRVVRYDAGTFSPVDAEGASADDPDVLLQCTPADIEAIRAGTLDPTVAFMRGTMKMRGDPGLLLQVLPVLARDPSPAFDPA